MLGVNFNTTMRQALADKYDGWTVAADSMFVCPCGHRVEDDGNCPNGHESPMLQMGMI